MKDLPECARFDADMYQEIPDDWPEWAQFDADEYQEIPDDWRLLEVGDELCAHNIYCDPDCRVASDVEGLAATVVAHRYEIVALRKKLAEAQAENERLRGVVDRLVQVWADYENDGWLLDLDYGLRRIAKSAAEAAKETDR